MFCGLHKKAVERESEHKKEVLWMKGTRHNAVEKERIVKSQRRQWWTAKIDWKQKSFRQK